MYLQTAQTHSPWQSTSCSFIVFNGHWMAITRLSSLYRKVSTSGTFQMCDTCLASFYQIANYEKHLPCVRKQYIQTEIMPTEPLEFQGFNKCVALCDILYADMEAILEKCDDDADDDGLLQKHIPCCVGSYWVSKAEPFLGKYKEFKGPTCVLDF